MFTAFTVDFHDIPKDVNRDAFGGGCLETDAMKYYDDYMVVQVDGKTIYCKPELSEGLPMIVELMELAYYLGVLAADKHIKEIT